MAVKIQLEDNILLNFLSSHQELCEFPEVLNCGKFTFHNTQLYCTRGNLCEFIGLEF